MDSHGESTALTRELGAELRKARKPRSCPVTRWRADWELYRLLDLAREADNGYRLRPHGTGLPDELRSLVVRKPPRTTSPSSN
jgi:hypothetical protein